MLVISFLCPTGKVQNHLSVSVPGSSVEEGPEFTFSMIKHAPPTDRKQNTSIMLCLVALDAKLCAPRSSYTLYCIGH